jgi:hypothetical protein
MFSLAVNLIIDLEKNLSSDSALTRLIKAGLYPFSNVSTSVRECHSAHTIPFPHFPFSLILLSRWIREGTSAMHLALLNLARIHESLLISLFRGWSLP